MYRYTRSRLVLVYYNRRSDVLLSKNQIVLFSCVFQGGLVGTLSEIDPGQGYGETKSIVGGLSSRHSWRCCPADKNIAASLVLSAGKYTNTPASLKDPENLVNLHKPANAFVILAITAYDWIFRGAPR